MIQMRLYEHGKMQLHLYFKVCFSNNSVHLQREIISLEHISLKECKKIEKSPLSWDSFLSKKWSTCPTKKKT